MKYIQLTSSVDRHLIDASFIRRVTIGKTPLTREHDGITFVFGKDDSLIFAPRGGDVLDTYIKIVCFLGTHDSLLSESIFNIETE
jgi:hypothetical protein